VASHRSTPKAVRDRSERRFEIAVMVIALVAVCFRSAQWRLGLPDLSAVSFVLLLVPLAVRTQITISRGATDLTLGAAAAALFAFDVTSRSSVLPIWAVIVAISYAVFYRDETWGQFRAAIQVLGGAALVRVAEVTDIGYRPYDRVFTGLATYFAVIALLELARRTVVPDPADGRGLHLRWTWTFLVGLLVFYIGCLLSVLRWLEAGRSLPVGPSAVVLLVGMAAIGVGLLMRNRELHRSVAALSGAAVAMPWPSDLIDDTLGRWGARGLRVEDVEVRERPGSRWDFSVALDDGRFVVARRSPGDLPFTQVEMNVVEALANMSDRSRRESEQLEELRDRANTDGLTGLSTYTYFREVLAGVSTSRRPGESIAIVFIDLDGFKEINDRYGHVAGDAALQVMAARLLTHTGDRLAVTRYGGDEFAVLVRDVTDYSALTAECERLKQLVGEPVVIGEDTLRLRASMGSAMSSSPEDSMEDIVRAADQQMYQRKRAIHARDGQMATRIDQTVRRAIVERRLATAYQPVVKLDVDEIRAMEVLVRHTDTELGSIPPPIIVESAIRLNLLDDLTLQVLEQAIETMIECRSITPEMTAFAINLEIEQIATWSPLVERIARCEAETGLRPVIEISESSIGRWTDTHARVAARLQTLNVAISIDDFGSGYAHIASLYLPEASAVKLDRSLVVDLDNPRQAKVVTRITELLVELGFWVVAEGITQPSEAEVLGAAGATHGQGYLYGMPLDRELTVARLRRSGLAPIAAPLADLTGT
jgi:diguanylate cyclase (GGDEF)-like protein